MDAFVVTIKQYEAKEQAELHVRIMVPGTWFPNLTPAEKKLDYEAEATEHVPSHKFPKKGERAAMTCAALKFLCKDDVAEDAAHSGFIMPIAEWNRFRHETYKNNREAENIYIRRPVAAEPKEQALNEPERPLIYSEFSFVNAGTHKVKPKNGGPQRDVKCEWWLCSNTSGKCKHRLPIKVVEKATTKLIDHLKTCNNARWITVRIGSKGGEDDGSGGVLLSLSFKEMLPHHVRFVIMIVLEWDHLHKCRSKARKAYTNGLRRGAAPPHRETAIKIMKIIKSLMDMKLMAAMAAVLAELGDHSIGAQDDIWSMTNCKESYGCMRASFIHKDLLGLLHDVNPLLAFRTFATSSHTGLVIKTWKVGICSGWGLDATKSMSLWTEDGAANNILSSKLLGALYEVCGPHQVQRAILFALGLAGKTSKNPMLKAFIGRMSKQSSSFHSSGVASKAMQDSQLSRGVKPHQLKSTEVANATRWTGIFRCAQKTRMLEADIKVGLTGEADGVAMEDQAPIPHALGGTPEEDEDVDEAVVEVDSDADQVAANESAGKKFPLAHRCLSDTGFKQTNQLEGVLLPAHETVSIMQKASGMDPGTTYLLAASCHVMAKAGKLTIISGMEGKETYKEMNEASLDTMFRTYRTEFALQMAKRFKLNSHPGVHVTLCWKMNPSINTLAESPLFTGKPSVYQLMEGEYMSKLRMRFLAGSTGKRATPTTVEVPVAPPLTHAQANPTDAGQAAAAAVPARPAPSPAVASSKKRRKLSILDGVAQFTAAAAFVNTTAVEDQIAAEIKKFEALSVAAATDEKYIQGGFFDMLAFFNDHAAAIPIHTAVYRADVGSMKGASASVESVFSGVKRLIGDFASRMAPEVLELYVFIHYNWQYEFMRPTIDEIVKAYVKAYGPEAREEDLMAGADSEEEGGSASEAEEEAEEEEDAEEEAAGL